MNRAITTTWHPDLLEDLGLIAEARSGKGLAFQRLVKLAGITQTQLATKVGLDRSTLSHWISERIWLSSETMLKYLRLLAVDQARLIQCFGSQVKQAELQEVLSKGFSYQNASVSMGDLIRELDNQNIEDAD
jgi:transcriptional regulator with XRE-family HTH domain